MVDVVSVVVVRRQRHGAAEGGGVERGIVVREVRLEVADGAVLVEDGGESVPLVTRGVDGGVVDVVQELFVRHILRSVQIK